MKKPKGSLADLRRLRAAAAQAPQQPKPRRPQPEPPPRPPHTAAPGTDGQTTPVLDAADRALFKQAMRFVQPLPDRGPRARVLSWRDAEPVLRARRQHAQGSSDRFEQVPAEPPKQRHHPEQAYDPDAKAFVQTGCGPDLLRGLRKGKWAVQATLDLHGSTLEQARERLDRFLTSCLEHDIRCVRIVHGKGLGSRTGASVLKAPIRLHLCRLAAIQAWVECGERDGGAGAVTALLRQVEEA